MPGFRDVFPPKPTFTEEHLEDQAGKVFIITGANSGVGFELAKLLYQKNGTVYIAARSGSKIKNAIDAIEREFPSSTGRLASVVIDLSDLSTIRPAAQDFLEKETRLDVLFHNAGVMLTSNDARSSQGHELRMATNCLGPQLLTHMLAPLLIQTARNQPERPDSVRLVWVSSMINSGSPKGGIVWDDVLNKPKILPGGMEQYMQTKVGDVLLAHEWGERLAGDGVVSVSLHPGLMKTELQRDSKAMQTVMGIIFKPAKFGAYTELFAGFSPDVTVQKNGSFLIAWGRFSSIPDDIAIGIKSKEQGGTGLLKRFWDYCRPLCVFRPQSQRTIYYALKSPCRAGRTGRYFGMDALAFSLLLVGVFSFIYHATLHQETQFLDEMSMFMLGSSILHMQPLYTEGFKPPAQKAITAILISVVQSGSSGPTILGLKAKMQRHVLSWNGWRSRSTHLDEVSAETLRRMVGCEWKSETANESPEAPPAPHTRVAATGHRVDCLHELTAKSPSTMPVLVPDKVNMNYANMIEEASLKKTFIVATLVSTLVGTFAASHNLYERLSSGQKKKDAGQDDELKKLREEVEQMKNTGKSDQKKPDELEQNLNTSGPVIKHEYDVGYGRLGRRFAVGDMITENELQKQIILLQQTVIGVLEDALYSGRQIDRAGVDKLIYASRAARNGSLEALQGQYQRLVQSAPPPRTPKTIEAEVIELSSRGSSPRRPPPPRALLPPPPRSRATAPPPSRSASKMRQAKDFFCRYSIDLERSPNMPLARSFDPGRESRCPACKHRIPVDSDEMWDVDFPVKGKLPPAPVHPRAPSPGHAASTKGSAKKDKPTENGEASRGRSKTGKEVVAVTEQTGKKLTFRIPARFIVKCHTPMGEYACGLCAGARGDSAVIVLCETPEDLVDHIAKEHKTADMEKD
ncbi:hypothetical protein diail_8339, partial [Diaporthe ilicicola]